MKIHVLGGGPAGLYFALLMKRLDARHEITVVERNARGVTFGWGVVFSDETLGNFAEADPDTHREIVDSFAYWSDIDIVRPGHEPVRSTGHGFCGMARRRLLEILEAACERSGVELRFGTEVDDPEAFRDADLVLAADGVNSRCRDRYAESFSPQVEQGRCRFTWLGTDRRYDAFTFVFKRDEHGLFQVHAYPFDAGHSTFIVECHEDVWRRAGLDTADEAATVAYLEDLFRDELGGGRLLTNRSIWRSFPTVSNARWSHENVVLMGDAAHTAHFSIGSGTKLAMEDAIALRAAVVAHGGEGVPAVLDAYEAARRDEVGRLQSAARTSREWFENSARHADLEPLPFALSLMTRSKRITYDKLRERDPELVDRATAWFARANPHRTAVAPLPPRAARGQVARPAGDDVAPAFQPYRMRGLTLANRIVVSPMCQYSCEDGLASDWHLVHLGSRALGGAGLVIAEATAVTRDGRISPGCAGLYLDEHVEAWRRVVDFVHEHSRAAIGMQLAHAGRKASSGLAWEGGLPLAPDAGAWPTVAASPLAWDQGWPTPRELDRADMDAIRDAFVAATRRADAAGFDLLELHMAHGYLLASFLSPLTNHRGDAYGGELAGRLRFPLEVLEACRDAWPDARPLSVRISATDWAPGGLSDHDRLGVARALRDHGADIVDVSAGGTVPDQRPVYGRMFQVPFSEHIRLEGGVPTMTVGNIRSADQCHTILIAGRADLCVLARAHLADPYLTLRAAEAYGYEDQYWPPQYLRARMPPRPGGTRR